MDSEKTKSKKKGVAAVIAALLIAAFTGPTCPPIMIIYLPGHIGVDTNNSTLPAFTISSAVWMPTGMLLISTNPIAFFTV